MKRKDLNFRSLFFKVLSMCTQIKKSIAVFSNFKPESKYHPNWGLYPVLQTQRECNSKKTI